MKRKFLDLLEAEFGNHPTPEALASWLTLGGLARLCEEAGGMRILLHPGGDRGYYMIDGGLDQAQRNHALRGIYLPLGETVISFNVRKIDFTCHVAEPNRVVGIDP